MDIVSILSNLLSSDYIKRNEAEKLMTDYAQNNFEDYLEKLGNLLVNEEIPNNVRVAATTLIKNPITYISLYTNKWLEFPVETKSKIRTLILSALGSKSSDVRRGAASVVATIAKIDFPLTKNWPELLPILCNENIDNKELRITAIETLGFICEELNNKQLSSQEIDQILSAIVLCIQKSIEKFKESYNNDVCLKLCTTSTKALIRAIPLITNEKMNYKEYSDILINELFRLGDSFQTNEQVLELVCRSFIEVAENYYDCIELYLNKISMFTFNMISTNNQRLKLLGFEFWYRLGSEELERYQRISNKKVCKMYFQSYYYKLKELIESYIVSNTKDDIDNDEWNTSKAACSLLIILVQVIKEDNYRELVEVIKGKQY